MAADDEDDGTVSNIRETLVRRFIGARVVDITSTDWDEIQRGEQGAVMLLFDNGGTMTFPVDIDEGFSFELPDE